MERYYMYFFIALYIGIALLLYFLPKRINISENMVTIIEALMFGGIVFACLHLSTYEAIGDSLWMQNNMNKLLNQSFYSFYDDGGIPYPPLYNYLYFIIGKIDTFLSIPIDWHYKSFILSGKIPNLVALYGMTLLICKHGIKKRKENELLLFFISLYQPGYILAGVLVLQFDALYTFFIVLTISLLYTNHLKASYFSFAAGILFKYQTLFISPLILWVTISKLKQSKYNIKSISKYVIAALSAIALLLLSFLPFLYKFSEGFTKQSSLTTNISNAVVGFSRASTNAYNFWTLFGYNMEPVSNKFGPWSCSIWGTIFLISLIIISGFIYHKYNGDKNSFPIVAAFMTAGIFTFENKMMARYLYPTIILLIFAFAIYPTIKRFILSLLYSVTFFINLMYDFFIIPYKDAYNHDRIEPYIYSGFTLICFIYLCYVISTETRVNPKQTTISNIINLKV